MLRLLLVLLIGLTFEAAGVTLLARGQKQMAGLREVSAPAIWEFVRGAVTNRDILLGVALEAAFFGCLLYLMARSEISFLWPLTGLSFLFTTIAARIFLHEQVSGLRWFGVALIVAGAAVITYTEKVRRDNLPPASAVPSAPSSGTRPG